MVFDICWSWLPERSHSLWYFLFIRQEMEFWRKWIFNCVHYFFSVQRVWNSTLIPKSFPDLTKIGVTAKYNTKIMYVQFIPGKPCKVFSIKVVYLLSSITSIFVWSLIIINLSCLTLFDVFHFGRMILNTMVFNECKRNKPWIICYNS